MNAKSWLRLAIINLTLVALVGVILRYKILFPLPFVDQKHLLHGHSHFAFSGWVSQALMTLLVWRVSLHSGKNLFEKYNPLLWTNLLCAYGMLLSFPAQGYGLVSITFSTGTNLIAWLFAVHLWRDMNACKKRPLLFSWFKAAVVFQIISSIGTYGLAFLMATHTVNQNLYLGLVYFFLHFQYNGWFSFAVLGLLCEQMEAIGITSLLLRRFFYALIVACLPAYFLSALWMPLPGFVFVGVVLSAVVQVLAWGWIVIPLYGKRKSLKNRLGILPYRVISLSLLAFSVKLMLQLASTIPSLSTLAFGFRPVVIGYLHLVLLGFVSLFILGYALCSGLVVLKPMSRLGIWIFISGIIGNEVALLVQGALAMDYLTIAHIPEILFGMACVLFSGLLLISCTFFEAEKLEGVDF
jgi:hypothetical protein